MRDISVVPLESRDQAYLEHLMDDMEGLGPRDRGGRPKRKSSVIVKSLRKISSKTEGIVIRTPDVVLANETETNL